MARDNRSLGRFDLTGIPPAPRGVPQIEVTFDIDANGILNVKAIDKATNREQSIRITGSSGLSQEEIDRMVKEAKEHEEEDKRRKELAETRNQADTLIYSIEKNLKEFGDKVSESERKNIQNAIEKLRKAMAGDDISLIKREMEELQKASYKLAEEMYKKAGEKKEEPKREEKKPEEKKEEGPIEAEYEVVDEEKEEKDKKKE
jgi:molecular chaperone DnaK